MDKKVEILLHNVEYLYKDKPDMELTETDKEHIHYMIEQGFVEGQLVSWDFDNDEDIIGWWRIIK